MPDNILDVPASVTVAFPRADWSSLATSVEMNSGVRVQDWYSVTTFGAGHSSTQLIQSTAIANFAGVGSPVNSVELGLLAAQISSDWYAWRLSCLEIRFESMVAWAADGMHDIEFMHQANGISTSLHRSEWEPQWGQLQHAGHFGSSAEPPIVGAQGVEIESGTLLDGVFDANLLLRDNSAESDSVITDIWVYDWAGAKSLLASSKYNGTFRGIEAHGPYYISLVNANIGNALSSIAWSLLLSLTPTAWSAGVYPLGSYVSYSGDDYVEVNPAGTAGTPGSSADWVKADTLNYAGGWYPTVVYRYDPVTTTDVVRELRPTYSINSSSPPKTTVVKLTGPPGTRPSATYGSIWSYNGIEEMSNPLNSNAEYENYSPSPLMFGNTQANLLFELNNTYVKTRPLPQFVNAKFRGLDIAGVPCWDFDRCCVWVGNPHKLTHTADACLAGKRALTHTADACLATKGISPLTHTADAYLAVAGSGYVQGASSTGSLVSSITTTFGAASTSGNLLFLCVMTELPVTGVFVTTPAGWTLLKSTLVFGHTRNIYTFCKISAGETSVTANFTGTATVTDSSFNEFGINYPQGGGTYAGTLDTDSNNSATSSGPCDSGTTGTTAYPDCLATAFLSAPNFSAVGTPTNGFTAPVAGNSNMLWSKFCYKYPSSNAGLNTSGTISGSGDWVGQVVTNV